MQSRLFGIAALGAGILAAAGGAVFAAEQQGSNAQPVAEAGRRLVAEHCSGCHSIDAEGDSPNPAAPPLRTLAYRYPDEALTKAFEDGLLTAHPQMPHFKFSQSELKAILAYLHSIQEMQGV